METEKQYVKCKRFLMFWHLIPPTHSLQCKNPDANFMTLGTMMPSSSHTDAGLNPDNKG
jgi:hypothetical protein